MPDYHLHRNDPDSQLTCLASTPDAASMDDAQILQYPKINCKNDFGTSDQSALCCEPVDAGSPCKASTGGSPSPTSSPSPDSSPAPFSPFPSGACNWECTYNATASLPGSGAVMDCKKPDETAFARRAYCLNFPNSDTQPATDNSPTTCTKASGFLSQEEYNNMVRGDKATCTTADNSNFCCTVYVDPPPVSYRRVGCPCACGGSCATHPAHAQARPAGSERACRQSIWPAVAGRRDDGVEGWRGGGRLQAQIEARPPLATPHACAFFRYVPQPAFWSYQCGQRFNPVNLAVVTDKPNWQYRCVSNPATASWGDYGVYNMTCYAPGPDRDFSEVSRRMMEVPCRTRAWGGCMRAGRLHQLNRLKLRAASVLLLQSYALDTMVKCVREDDIFKIDRCNVSEWSVSTTVAGTSVTAGKYIKCDGRNTAQGGSVCCEDDPDWVPYIAPTPAPTCAYDCIIFTDLFYGDCNPNGGGVSTKFTGVCLNSPCDEYLIASPSNPDPLFPVDKKLKCGTPNTDNWSCCEAVTL